MRLLGGRIRLWTVSTLWVTDWAVPVLDWPGFRMFDAGAGRAAVACPSRCAIGGGEEPVALAFRPVGYDREAAGAAPPFKGGGVDPLSGGEPAGDQEGNDNQ